MANAKTTHAGKCSFHPDVVVDSFWVNQNQIKDGSKGMMIHLKFSLYDLKEVNCAMVIYFYYDFDKPLRDKNQKFYTQSGDVAVFTYLSPKFDITDYKDLQVFMPYDELELAPGTHKLKMDVDLNYDDGTRIQHLKNHDFN